MKFVARPKEPFKNQVNILTSIVKIVCGHGGLAISTVEKEWFRTLLREVEPCSSAHIERLFSKAGIILNQCRTRTASSKLEKKKTLLKYTCMIIFINIRLYIKKHDFET